MAMFALPSLRRELPALRGERVFLRMPVVNDFREWAALRQESRRFLEPWEPRWTVDELERSAWRQRLRRYRDDHIAGTAVPFFIFTSEPERPEQIQEKWKPVFRPDTGGGTPPFLRLTKEPERFRDKNRENALVGGITIGNIRQGVSQCGQIGYWVGERYAGRGYMLEAIRLVTGYAFQALRLHRIEAACIPDNQRSMRVLEKAGFQQEGLLRSYLRINGAWKDHYLYALIADDRPGDRRG